MYFSVDDCSYPWLPIITSLAVVVTLVAGAFLHRFYRIHKNRNEARRALSKVRYLASACFSPHADCWSLFDGTRA